MHLLVSELETDGLLLKLLNMHMNPIKSEHKFKQMFKKQHFSE